MRCREIGVADLSGILELLQRGFPERSHGHFARALVRLSSHHTPAGFPKFGYMLEADGVPVGAVLVIFSSVVVNGEAGIRGNVASWYVEPAFRTYAAMLSSHALAFKNVSYLNISPARNTWPILEAQGYRQFSRGEFAAVPAIRADSLGASVRLVSATTHSEDGLSASEVELLHAHATYGCVSAVCESRGRQHPFVFAKRWTRWKSIPVPYALLVYCRDVDDFVRFAGPLGRFLMWRGMPLVFIDANGPIPGLTGRFLDWGPKFYKGPHAPSLGDIAYTERVMFEL